MSKFKITIKICQSQIIKTNEIECTITLMKYNANIMLTMMNVSMLMRVNYN